MMDTLIHASRQSTGLLIKKGTTNSEEIFSLNLDPKTNSCRSLKFSNNGEYLCYCDSSRTVLIETLSGEELFSLPELTKTQKIEFSPLDSTLITYQPYVIYGSRTNPDGSLKQPKPNLNFFSIKERKFLKVFTVKKQSAWKPQFTKNESTMLRLSEQGLFMHKNSNLDEFERIIIKDLESFAISPGLTSYVACFIPGLKGQPAVIQLREINNIMSVTFKMTSFNCDECNFMWNSKGTAVLVTASVDVDKTDQSYYGVSNLYCISTKMEYFQVYLDKQGPLHSVKWSPNGKEFCVCYGLMPSKVTIFNLKGDIIWNIGEGHRNEVYYSPFGDVLVTCGFGNISSGKMTFWNVDTKKEIIQYEAPLTTYFEWAPDGRHFLTATTASRLKENNGYRIWHYGKGVVYTNLMNKEELLEVTWRPSKAYEKQDVLNLTAQQIAVASSNNAKNLNIQKISHDFLPPGAITKTGVYVPPAMRKQNLKDNIKKVSNAQVQDVATRRQLTEKEKKIRSLQKKLTDIVKLKEKESTGVKLEINQLKKIETELSLRKELENLQLLN